MGFLKFFFMKIKGKKFTYVCSKKPLFPGKAARVEMIIHPGAVLIIPFTHFGAKANP